MLINSKTMSARVKPYKKNSADGTNSKNQVRKHDDSYKFAFSVFLFLSLSFYLELWLVVGPAHIQAFAFSWRWLLKTRSVVGRAQIQAFSKKCTRADACALHK